MILHIGYSELMKRLKISGRSYWKGVVCIADGISRPCFVWQEKNGQGNLIIGYSYSRGNVESGPEPGFARGMVEDICRITYFRFPYRGSRWFSR